MARPIATVALIVGLASCGGGSDDSDGQLDEAEYVELREAFSWIPPRQVSEAAAIEGCGYAEGATSLEDLADILYVTMTDEDGAPTEATLKLFASMMFKVCADDLRRLAEGGES